MRVPLSWLCDFAPFEADHSEIAATLDDLGLVVEEMKHVGRGLEEVVVARVVEISAIPGADKIRRVVVDAGSEPVEVVCGAWNFSVDDLVALAPVGAVLPGGLAIARRKMKGVVSNGMLCSGVELQLSDDHEGILVLGSSGHAPADPGQTPGYSTQGSGSAPAPAPAPGMPLTVALGIEPDVVFDIAVDANRPDAGCVAGVARDLAARMRLPFTLPDPPLPATGGLPPTSRMSSVEVSDPDLCPRFTARVLTGVEVGPSPRLIASRLLLAGMRPVNNVVDASNYVMLDLGQPTHPYDLDRVPGGGLRVRAAARGEQVLTLDGTLRTLGQRSTGREDDLRDCVICDAADTPIGIAGVMGGATSEITDTTGRVLLEAAYFAPMAIARTSKRLNLRTEASSRFERGVDLEGIDRASLRFCELLGRTGGPAMSVAPEPLDVRTESPGPRRIQVRTSRVNAVLGIEMSDSEIVGYLEPIGFVSDADSSGVLNVTVPSFRPDTEREIDVIEEVARHHGYARLPRRRRFAAQVGGLSAYQRERRLVRDVLAGSGADEAWTPSLLGPEDHARAGLEGPEWRPVRLANPLTPEESVLRCSLLPGLLKALEFNRARRQGDVRLFEVGKVFPFPGPERIEQALKHEDAKESVIDEREMLGLLMAGGEDDALTAVHVWLTLAGALDLEAVQLLDTRWREGAAGAARGARTIRAFGGLHPTRTCEILAVRSGSEGSKSTQATSRESGEDRGQSSDGMVIGVVGEVDPSVLERFGVDTAQQRAGWLEVDLGLLLRSVPRRARVASPVSRFPSSDVDLAFVLDESVPATAVTSLLERASGPLLEAISLFDVYRGDAVPAGSRSLTWRLRFRAFDHTLTDEEVGQLRAACIEAVQSSLPASLRT